MDRNTRRRKRYEKLLEATQIGSTILDSVADGAAFVPGIKCATALVREIVNAALTVNINKSDCDDLVEETWAYLDRIYRVVSAEDGPIVSTTFHADVLLFKRELKEILELLQRLAARKYHIWFLQHSSDKRAIEDHKLRLRRALDHLQIAGTLETQVQLKTISHHVAVIRRHTKCTSDRLNSLRLEAAEARSGRAPMSDTLRALAIPAQFHLPLPNAPEFDASEFIRLMTPTKLLWKRTALALTSLVDQQRECYHGHAKVWLEAKITARIIHEWPTATRALIWTNWEDDRFWVMVELREGPVVFDHDARYEHFWIEATDLQGMQGIADEEDSIEEDMRMWMDSQMYMPWNSHALD